MMLHQTASWGGAPPSGWLPSVAEPRRFALARVVQRCWKRNFLLALEAAGASEDEAGGIAAAMSLGEAGWRRLGGGEVSAH
ncbi:MAG TPA: hypothetical protein VF017_15970 [Thermoanaerobaculia bacterium]|nr:hypothetical protein [Thermoanaerobaculia bacterium]